MSAAAPPKQRHSTEEKTQDAPHAERMLRQVNSALREASLRTRQRHQKFFWRLKADHPRAFDFAAARFEKNDPRRTE